MKHRWIAVALVAWGCASGGGGVITPDAPPAPAPVTDPAPKPGKPTVLIAMPGSSEFLDARRGLITEIQKDFNVSTLLVGGGTRLDELEAKISATAPVCLVLMNNRTVNLYHRYQLAHRSQAQLPSVVVMASLLEELLPSLVNATGIAYEVPGVTGLVNLRAVINRPLKRVGVVFRPVFRGFIERQKQLAAREHFELVPVEVSKDVEAEELRTALERLLAAQKVDALWMLNDNGLIKSADFLDRTWRAELQQIKVPLIVGVPNLVDPQNPLGTFAQVPDHEALGLQTANLIFELADDDWKAGGHGVELPLSVKTIVDVKQARESFGLKEDALRHIDKELK